MIHGVSALSHVVTFEEDEESDRGRYYSPTQITTYIECARKWAWKRIAKVETPQAASAELGSRTHGVLERYLGQGIRPDFVAHRKAAEVACSGLHLLPEPKTKGMQLEREFRFKSLRTGFVYGGLKDVELAPGSPVAALGFDGSVPIVLDHKTTKSINKYAKSGDDLLFDAQSTIYAIDSMVRFSAPSADLAWIYYQTEGPRRASPTTVRLESEHAARVLDAIESVASEADSALERGLQPQDLPPNPDACGAYGGCPYRHLCNLSPSQIVRSRMSNSLIANLRARVQGSVLTVPAGEGATATVISPQAATQEPSPASASEQAPEEIPEWAKSKEPFTGAALETAQATEPTVAVNPPESALPPPAAEAPEEKPKRGRGRAKKDETPAPPEAVTSAPPPTQPDPATTYEQNEAKGDLERTIQTMAGARNGWTLYVDCIPFGRPAKALDSYIASAQARMPTEGPRDEAGNPVPDYRLAAFGRGAAALASFVCEALEGKDLFLDTRTPEGAILLAPLSARASLVVRGLR